MAHQLPEDTRATLLAGLFLLVVGPGCASPSPTESSGIAAQAIGAPTCVRIQRGASGGAEDAHLSEHKPDKNWGHSAALTVGSVPPGRRQALVRFDLGPVPAGAVVTSATLAMHVIDGGAPVTMEGDPPYPPAQPVRVHRATSSWSEASVTWNGFAGAYSSAVEATLTGSGNAFSADLTQLVSGWVSGAYPNDGILLERDPMGLTELASSDDATDPSRRPALDVCYVSGEVCGDGNAAATEGCDDGNTIDGDGCSAACAPEAGYACAGSPSICATVCGDGITAGAEACDDGNTIDGDGCSAACAPEAGYACAGSPSICATVCGDGLVLGSEGCDDGNSASGDGCSAACAVEAGFACSGSPSACAAICGDGIVAGGEGCDDGNGASGDGCSAACAVEGGFSCSGSPSACVCANGTPCNDGNQCTTGDVCTSGACAGTVVVCTPGECQSGGACDGQTGQCVFAPAADGDACTGGACQGGQCVQTQLMISVYDRNGNPLSGARVVVGGVQKISPTDGKVTYSGVVAGDTVARITATGYAPASPTLNVRAGAHNSIVAHLLNEGEPIPFQAASGVDTIVDDKVRVVIPGDALVRADGTPLTNPVVEMTVAPLDPSTSDLELMPGELIGMPEGGTEPVGMISVFMADITLRQGTSQVKLAPGAKATIEYTLPDAVQGDYQVGDTIDAWYFDTAQGIWIQEGSGTVQASLADPGKLVWTAEVSHFSWWNADFWKPRSDCVIVTVVQSDNPGAYVGGATVTVSSLSNNFYRYSNTTDALTGQACIDMPINDVVQVTASHAVFANVAGGPQQLTTGTDSNGPTCSGAGVGACKTMTLYVGGNTCLNGVVEDGVGGFIDGASVIARYNTGRGPESRTTTSDVNGEYCVEAPVGTQVVVQANSAGRTDEKSVTAGNSQLACGDLGCTAVPALTPMCDATCAKWAFGDGNASLQTARDVAVDASGNVFIAGYFQGAMPGLGLTSNGQDDIYVAKFDPDGNLVWAKRFGDAAGTGTQQAYAIAVDALGNPVIVGSFTGAVTFGTLTLTADQGFDGFITKLSGVDGSAIEARKVGGLGNQRVVDVLLDSSDPAHPDTLVILAYFNDQIDCSGGVGGMCAAVGGDDILIMKIFSNSYHVWSQTYGGAGDEHVAHGGLDSSGNLVLTGDFNSAFSFGSPTGTLTPSSSGTDAFVAKIRLPCDFGSACPTSPTPVWSRSFGANAALTPCSISPGNRNGRGTAFDGLGNVWLTGDFNGCVVLSTALEVSAGAPATDAFWTRLDGATGSTINYDIIRNASQQHGSDITVDTDGGLILTGTVRGSITFDVVRPAIGLEDLFLAKLSTSGTYVWSRRFGGGATSVVANPAVAVRPYAPGALVGDIAVTGTYTGNVVFDAANGIEVLPGGGSDVLVSKMLSVQ